MKFWRHPADQVPEQREALIEWLYERWQELDDWIGEVRSGGAVAIGAKA
jgi:hypothetical protein